MKIAPRGWNSWDCYGSAVTEEIVRQNADFMAKHLKKYGWEYVVVDIQWYEPLAASHEYHPFTELCMDEFGRLLPAENRFPSAKGGKGFGPLAEYVHSLGLKFGIHIMRGIPRQAVHQNLPVYKTNKTAREVAKTDSICCWNTDMYGLDPKREGARAYYDSIFSLYASWGVDFIKCDDIARELPKEEEELIMLSESLKGCARPMVLSLSPGPALIEKAELYKQVANMWRITDDFWDRWDLLYNMFERAEKWCIHSGAGHWPDADMLPIGALRQCYDPNETTNFTKNEQITMMSLWAIMRSPLFIGGEMTKFDEFTMSLITNDEIMKMHQNARGSHPVFRREVEGNEIIAWMAHSVEGGTYVALFHTGEEGISFCVDLEEFEIDSLKRIRELWSNKEGLAEREIDVHLTPHGAKVYYIE